MYEILSDGQYASQCADCSAAGAPAPVSGWESVRALCNHYFTSSGTIRPSEIWTSPWNS